MREYLAGFFDADGAVGISKGAGTSYYLLWVRVNQVVPTPLLMFKQQYGGKINGPTQRGENSRPIWGWCAESQVAEDFLQDIVSLLVVKRERVELALEFRSLFKGEYRLPRGNARPTEANLSKRAEVISLRSVAYHEMARLNKRGIA
jgi:hypothetical protein